MTFSMLQTHFPYSFEKPIWNLSLYAHRTHKFENLRWIMAVPSLATAVLGAFLGGSMIFLFRLYAARQRFSTLQSQNLVSQSLSPN